MKIYHTAENNALVTINSQGAITIAHNLRSYSAHFGLERLMSLLLDGARWSKEGFISIHSSAKMDPAERNVNVCVYKHTPDAPEHRKVEVLFRFEVPWEEFARFILQLGNDAQIPDELFQLTVEELAARFQGMRPQEVK